MATKPAKTVSTKPAPDLVVNPRVVAARNDPQVLAQAGITNGMPQDAIDARIAGVLGVPMHI